MPQIDLNSPQLAIFNTLGEEALMLSIHELFLGYPKKTIECSKFQKRSFDKLLKKCDKESIYHKEMLIEISNGHSAVSVMDFIDVFAHVREVAREKIMASQKYGTVLPMPD